MNEGGYEEDRFTRMFTNLMVEMEVKEHKNPTFDPMIKKYKDKMKIAYEDMIKSLKEFS